MKYAIEELHFAAHIRDLTAALRNGAKPVAENGEWKSPEFLALMAQWEKDNPTVSFVPKAMALVKETADAIRINLQLSE